MITASLRPYEVALQRSAVSPRIRNILRISVQHSLIIVLKHGHSQVVDFPTRVNNILGVIFTDDDCIVTAIKSCPPVGYSDHCAIEFTMTPTPVE